ncbi:MAG: hypothetical protein HUJ27_05645 [Rhodobacteraceae bacterium]|nr:hypothetical protein [Paracoccaceae bacterium]
MMETAQITQDHTSRRHDLKIAIACIENPVLRQYCTEQMLASETPEDFDATVSLVMELAAQPMCCEAN